jgi:hypothetical protein
MCAVEEEPGIHGPVHVQGIVTETGPDTFRTCVSEAGTGGHFRCSRPIVPSRRG